MRQLISFIMPFTVLVLVPLYLEDDISIKSVFAFVAGLVIMLAGLFVVIATIAAMIKIGKGTLAPWSPARRLVVQGMYRHVRNPMITGVFTVLIGESICIMSVNILYGRWCSLLSIMSIFWFTKSLTWSEDSEMSTGCTKPTYGGGYRGGKDTTLMQKPV